MDETNTCLSAPVFLQSARSLAEEADARQMVSVKLYERVGLPIAIGDNDTLREVDGF